MAGSETEWWSNRIYTWSITSSFNFEDIKPCKSITQGWSNNNANWVCTYIKWQDVLRYIYLY
jgi:hypothetical protein